MSRIRGFSGCCCLFAVEILRIFLSESGYPGLEDVQDVILLLFRKNGDFWMIDNIL
jgi:hypothetical protein